MTSPCLSLRSSNLFPVLIAGYSWPALAALSLPVLISRIPIHTVTNISILLLEHSASFVLVRISPAPLPSIAQLWIMILEIIMNSAAGIPLPLTSAITMHR